MAQRTHSDLRHPEILRHTVLLVTAVGGQTLLLLGAWGFLAAVLSCNPLVVSDYVAGLMHSMQTETTWIVTLIATILAIATNNFLSIAFKEALRHRMHSPILLVDLSGGVAVARNSFLINTRHMRTTLVTLVIFGLTKLLVSSWATLLTPTTVTWNVPASGWELDLTSSWFESILQQELVQSGAALVRGNSSEIIDIGGSLSGIAAAKYSFGTPAIFDFNRVKYNISTGGVLPAAPSYNGQTRPATANNTGLAFSGGLVPTHLDIHYPNGQMRQGLNQSYTLLQQGLTANVACQQVDSTASNSSSTYQTIPVPRADGTTDYWLWAWNITANCSEGQPSRQQYVMQSDSPTAPENSSTGFISSLVCPYPILQTGFSWEHFTLTTNGSWRYNFLPLASCTIDPLVTTSLVIYRDGVVNQTVVYSQPLGSSNTNLTRFLAAFVDYQARTTQGLTTNSIGDAMYSIYVSASSDDSTDPQVVTDILLRQLEQYWLGVIEFSGTFLRSAFSAYPLIIPDEARVSLNGTMTITTMGWFRKSKTYGYTVIFITIVALMMYAAVAYILWSIYGERKHDSSFTTFDPSDPIQLMMVSSATDTPALRAPESETGMSKLRDSAGSPSPLMEDDESATVPTRAGDDLGCVLHGFGNQGKRENECVRVKLTDVKEPPNSSKKRFQVVTVPAPPASSGSPGDQTVRAGTV